jgi:DNA-binding MarR family transcriptional regulator
MAKDCLCFMTRKAARALTQIYDEALRPIGIRSTQLALLNTIHLLGAVNLKGLAAAMVIDRSTMARNIRPLEREGFIEIEPGEDLRELRVSLTREGLDKIEQALPLWEEAQARVKARVGEAHLDVFKEHLSALTPPPPPR